MEIEESIRLKLSHAMKEKDTNTINALRGVLSAIQTEMTKGTHHKLTDDEVVGVIKKQAKQHEESIEEYKKAGREDLVATEQAELDVLNYYLPEKFTREELETVIDIMMAEFEITDMRQMGFLLANLAKRHPFRFDNAEAAAIVRSKILEAKK